MWHKLLRKKKPRVNHLRKASEELVTDQRYPESGFVAYRDVTIYAELTDEEAELGAGEIVPNEFKARMCDLFKEPYSKENSKV